MLSTSEGIRRLAAYLWVLLVFGLPAATGSAAEAKRDAGCQEIRIPDDPRVLPYRFETIRTLSSPTCARGEVFLADVDGDRSVEFCTVWSDVVDSAKFLSTVTVLPHTLAKGKLQQYNGPLLSCLLWRHAVLDIWGDSGTEIVLTKHRGDSLFLDIVGFRLVEGILAKDSFVVIPAAVSRGFHPGEFWHDILIEPLIAEDLNGDGVRELIFSRSAKPDSAIARGVAAWDFAAGKEMWFLPMADMVGSKYPQSYRTRRGELIFVVSTNSNSNAYECRGMDSHHAYTLAFDALGEERWRRVVGGSGFYSTMCALDVDDDGFEEAVVSCEPEFDGVVSDTILRAFDPETGEVVAGFALGSLPACPYTPFLVATGDSAAPVVISYMTDSGNVAVRLNRRLEILGCWKGPVLVSQAFAGLLTEEPVVLSGSTPDGRTVILNRYMEPLVVSENGGTLTAGRAGASSQVLLSRGSSDFDLLEIQQQAVLTRIIAKYKSFLQIALAAVLLAAVLKGGAAVLGWRRAAMGLPTLDRIKALVLLLDARGRIVFMNRDPLSRELVGNAVGRRPHFGQTQLGKHEELQKVLSDSLGDPMQVHQHRLEHRRGEDRRQLEVTVYPHVGRHNEYNGKIVVVEDLADRPMWNWRLVLGEAAQRWVHKLKHHMGTARIVLGNLIEDSQIARRLESDAEFRRQWETADKEIMDGGEAATRILKFLRNSKPSVSECDLNDLVRTVVNARLCSAPESVHVSLMLQEDLPLIEVDTDQLREVVDNLMSNGIIALRGQGSITIRTRLAACLQGSSEQEVVEVAIEDTGVGIASADLPKIFEPGFSKSPGGTGIGLALVKDIVENHGGTVTADSEPHRGTRITVRLPRGGR